MEQYELKQARHLRPPRTLLAGVRPPAGVDRWLTSSRINPVPAPLRTYRGPGQTTVRVTWADLAVLASQRCHATQQQRSEDHTGGWLS